MLDRRVVFAEWETDEDEDENENDFQDEDGQVEEGRRQRTLPGLHLSEGEHQLLAQIDKRNKEIFLEIAKKENEEIERMHKEEEARLEKERETKRKQEVKKARKEREMEIEKMKVGNHTLSRSGNQHKEGEE